MGFENWKSVKLSDVAKVYDSLHKSPNYTTTGTPMIRVTDLSQGFLKIEDTAYVDDYVFEEFSKKHKPSKGNIIFSRVGSYGISSYVNTNEKFCLGQNTVAIVAESIEERFLYYSLISPRIKEQIEMMVTGSTQKTISLKSIRSFELSIPNKVSQNKISSFLFSLDEKIDVNIQIIKSLEQLTQTLFKRWFVDFEFPNENGEPYKLSGGEMVNSELGMIPNEWKVLNMSSFLNEKRNRVGELTVEEYSCTNTGIQLRDEKFKKSLSKNSAKNKLAEKGNIVFGMSRKVLNFGVMKAVNGGFSSAYHVYSIDSDVYNPVLLELFMRTNMEMFSDLIRPGAREGQGLDKGMLDAKNMIIPDTLCQNSFMSQYNLFMKFIDSIESENKNLKDLRDTLLPKLLSGEIEMPDETEVTEHVSIS